MKKILFVTIHFREYIDRIKNAISTELCADVDVIYSDFQMPLFHRIISKCFGKSAARWMNYQFQKVLFSHRVERQYDYIFVLVGRGINIEAFRQFAKQQCAKKILYLWDDVKRVDEYYEIKDLFNDIVSFDDVDCANNNLRFLPLFFCADYKYTGNQKDIDFSCIGGLHTYRECMLAKLQEIYAIEKYKWFSILSTTKFQILKMYMSGRKPHNFVKHTELNISETALISKRSKTVIDMPHLSQKGLSMRTIESLAAHAKIITTNNAISKYDFYNSDNVCIIDVHNPVIPDSFLNSEYVEPDEKIVEKYSLKNWVRTLFNSTEEQQ